MAGTALLALAWAAAEGRPVHAQGDTPGASGALELRGSLRDARTKRGVAGATVRIQALGLSTTTDDNGEYSFLRLPPGEQFLELAAPGYRPRRVRVEVLTAGSPGAEDHLLLPEGEGPRTLTIVGHLLEDTRAAVMIDREKQATTGERVGKEELRQSIESNTGGVLKSVPAVSIQGGKFAYVRGLGDRYSQTLVNGASIPSPEPEKRTIPLDLFPNNLVESLVVVKTYSPELPGEFAGGSVQIYTLDVPPESFFQLSTSLKYRDETTFRDFQSYEGGNLDAFTFDDGTRDLPDEVPSSRLPSGSAAFDQQVQEIGRSFENNWDVHEDTALPDHTLAFAGGLTHAVGQSGRLGVVSAGRWSNKYQNVNDEHFLVLADQGVAGVSTRNEYYIDTSTYVAELSGLLNVTYELNPAQRIGIRNLVSRTGEDRVRTQQGYESSEPDRPYYIADLKWTERFLYSGQLFGEHLLTGDQLLNWRYTYSRTESDEPDNRTIRYRQTTPGTPPTVFDSASSGRRYFSTLQEDVQDLGLDYAIPFNPLGVSPYGVDPEQAAEEEEGDGARDLSPDQKIQVGFAQTARERDFSQRRFRFSFPPGGVDENGNPIDYSAPVDAIFQPRNINPDGIALLEDTRPTDAYEASQDLSAGYVSADFRLVPRLRLQGGARVESSEQQVESFSLFGVPPERTVTELDDTDVMPAANVAFDLTEAMKLRFSYSETVNRPEFRELAEFEYTDATGGFSAVGNSELERAQLQNFDLRWEWFTNPLLGEVLAVSLFRKNLDQPIEKVILPAGSSLLTTWENADDGDLEGIEFELQKNLGFLADSFRNLRLNMNYARIESEVNASLDSSVGIQTNSTRPLQGQPTYTYNAALIYETPEVDGERFFSTLTANIFGQTLTAVGAAGVPDEYEQPRWALDFSIGKKSGPSTVRLTWENILDSPFEYEQGGITTREFKRGWAVGLSYSYAF